MLLCGYVLKLALIQLSADVDYIQFFEKNLLVINSFHLRSKQTPLRKLHACRII